MAKAREIKGRLKAVGNIERITKTMQMIATARFQATLLAATQSQAYTRKIVELVSDLTAASANDSQTNLAHPLLRRPSGTGKELLLVLTSNRGLCGGYNASVLRTASAFLRKQPEGGVDIEVVGKKGNAYFKFAHTEVSKTHTQFGDKPDYPQVEQLAEQYIEQFIAGKYDFVSVAYMTFQSMGKQTPNVLTLLPLSQDSQEANANESREDQASSTQYEYSPSPTKLLEELLPITAKTTLFQCFNEAIVSEHIARMVAMKNATDAAGKMNKELTRKFNRARQAAITTELSEIISGAAALQ